MLHQPHQVHKAFLNISPSLALILNSADQDAAGDMYFSGYTQDLLLPTAKNRLSLMIVKKGSADIF